MAATTYLLVQRNGCLAREALGQLLESGEMCILDVASDREGKQESAEDGSSKVGLESSG